MSAQTWVEVVANAGASGAAVANSTAETIIFPDIAIPAGFMMTGNALRTLQLRAIGQYSTTGTPTLIFTLRWGGVAGTLLCKTAACTLPSGVTAAIWDLDILIQTRTLGASGALLANGIARVHSAVAGTVGSATGEGLVTPMTNGGVITPATASVDLTAANTLSLTATWSAASSSDTLTGLHEVLLSLN